MAENPLNSQFSPHPHKAGRRITTIYLISIAVTALAAYSNSFDVPFIFDDIPGIIQNIYIHKLDYFLGPFGNLYTDNPVLWSRYVGFLSFTLNWKINGTNVAGYHAVNMAIHILNGWLVFMLVSLTFRSPRLTSSAISGRAGIVALFSSLIFVSHPLQTESVTYIVQRFTSLATLFYLGSIVSYAVFRLSGSRRKRIIFYITCLVSAVLSMKTKEIAVTLPAVILLYEFVFFEGKAKRRIIVLLPVLLTFIIVPASLFGAGKPLGDIMSTAPETGRIQTEISRHDYLITEFVVIAKYIKMLFLPEGQNVDHEQQLYESFSAPPVFLSFILLISLFILGAYLISAGRRGKPVHLLTGFGLLWFFITISPESSIIPIVDYMVEHRVYLPSVGAIIAFTASVFYIAERLGGRFPKAGASVVVILAIAVLSLSALTYARNELWRDPIAFWHDSSQKSPGKARPLNNYGIALEKNGLTSDAMAAYKKAIQIDNTYIEAYGNMASAYGRRGRYDKAIEIYEKAVAMSPDNPRLYYGLGVAYAKMGLFNEAIYYLEKAVTLEQTYTNALAALAELYHRVGRNEDALRVRKALEMRQ